MMRDFFAPSTPANVYRLGPSPQLGIGLINTNDVTLSSFAEALCAEAVSSSRAASRMGRRSYDDSFSSSINAPIPSPYSSQKILPKLSRERRK